MLSLPEDDRPLRPLLLREDAMRGGAPAIAGEQGRLSISAPFSIPLDEALVAGDSELDAFWKGQRELFDFDYVTFRCDFAPAEGAPIEKAWVQVKLKGAKDCRNAAVIWSMSPFRDEDLGKATLSAKIGGEFNLLKSEIGATTETQVKKWFLRARGEQEPEAFWEFRDNGTSHVDGTFRLNLVVRRPRGEPVNGLLDGGMVVAKRTFLFLTERREMEGNPTEFRLQ